jgi:tetratricopeptide (TPR) repeat protein
VCARRSDVLVELARAQLLVVRAEAADRTLGEILKREPRHAAALKLKGDARYLLGDAVEAERLFLAAAASDPKDPEPRYALGRVYYHQVKLELAIAEFRKVLDLDPVHYRAHDNLGLALEARGETGRALKSYEKALALVHKDHPEYDSVYANLADLLYRQGDFERSFQCAAEAASRNPASSRNSFLTGRALARLERWEVAAKWLQRALKLDPAHPAARYQLAQVYRNLGRHDEAEREFRALEKAATRQP